MATVRHNAVTTNRRPRFAMLTGLAVAIAGLAFFFLQNNASDHQANAIQAALEPTSSNQNLASQLPSTPPEPTHTRSAQASQPLSPLSFINAEFLKLKPAFEPLGATIDFVVKRNDTMERIFRQLQLSMSDLASLRGIPHIRTQLDSIKPGDSISFVHLDGTLLQMARRISETQVLQLSRETSGFTYTVISTPIELRTQRVHGTIETSLFAAAKSAGVSAETIMRLANDIFGWDIDFALDIQPGDSFNMVYEQKYRNGIYIGDGRIVAAEFINNGQSYQAVRFESDDGEINDYFTPDGRSMRKQFLRAPLDFNRVSSNFSRARLHPILNRIRAHQGVDYSAPTGTPIKAAGDGRIDSIGVKGGYGKAIILEHGGGITTLYGHLNRYAENMRDGTRVKQGQVIGYVGSTGAATGPHLHYEYRVNGIHKNPRTVSLPDALPVTAKYRTEFESKKSNLLAQLQHEIPSPVVAAAN